MFKFAAVLLLFVARERKRTASITGSPNGQDYRRMIAPRIYPICLTRLRWGRNGARPEDGTALQPMHHEKPTDH